MAGLAFSWPEIPQAVAAYVRTDEPNTKTAPAPTTAIIVPAEWLVLGGNYAELLVKRIDVEAVDFYPRTAT